MGGGDGGGGGRGRDNGTEVCDTGGAEAGGGGRHAPSPGSMRLPPARPSTSPPPESLPPPDQPTDASVPEPPVPVPVPRSGRTRSRWWYLLPIFLDIVGGVIAYFVLRADDPAKARNCLLLGTTLFAMHVAAFAALLLLFPE